MPGEATGDQKAAGGINATGDMTLRAGGDVEVHGIGAAVAQ